MYATVPITWKDATKTLTIGTRKGTFPGMLQSRSFHVVFVGTGHGTGIGDTSAPDATLTYTGVAVNATAP